MGGKNVLIEEVTFSDKLLEKDWIPSKYIPTFLITSSNLMMKMIQ
jgi:hypothetical protein